MDTELVARALGEPLPGKEDIDKSGGIPDGQECLADSEAAGASCIVSKHREKLDTVLAAVASGKIPPAPDIDPRSVPWSFRRIDAYRRVFNCSKELQKIRRQQEIKGDNFMSLEGSGKYAQLEADRAIDLCLRYRDQIDPVLFAVVMRQPVPDSQTDAAPPVPEAAATTETVTTAIDKVASTDTLPAPYETQVTDNKETAAIERLAAVGVILDDTQESVANFYRLASRLPGTTLARVSIGVMSLIGAVDSYQDGAKTPTGKPRKPRKLNDNDFFMAKLAAKLLVDDIVALVEQDQAAIPTTAAIPSPPPVPEAASVAEPPAEPLPGNETPQVDPEWEAICKDTARRIRKGFVLASKDDSAVLIKMMSIGSNLSREQVQTANEILARYGDLDAKAFLAPSVEPVIKKQRLRPENAEEARLRKQRENTARCREKAKAAGEEHQRHSIQLEGTARFRRFCETRDKAMPPASMNAKAPRRTEEFLDMLLDLYEQSLAA